MIFWVLSEQRCHMFGRHADDMVGSLHERVSQLTTPVPGKVNPPLLHHLNGVERGGKAVNREQAGGRDLPRDPPFPHEFSQESFRHGASAGVSRTDEKNPAGSRRLLGQANDGDSSSSMMRSRRSALFTTPTRIPSRTTGALFRWLRIRVMAT